jgi:molybdate transport system substrate-binding protein
MRHALIFLIMAAQLAHSEELSVAAASDLTYCIPAINDAFQKANPGAVVKVSFGSSGNFFEEIKNGAPFDVFLSADINYPKTLAKDGLGEEPVKYAEGRLVLWTMNGGLDISRGLAVLGDASVKHVAVANPDHAPYGRAAKAVLMHEHLWDALRSKLVFGENISQTAQFVQTGNADAGLLAMSLAVAPGMAHAGHFYEIPADEYPPLEQGAALTKAGAAKPLARAYLAFLQSEEARKILEQFGFRLPK